jgi:hypothetical protein
MSMIINTNVSALNAQRNLSVTNARMGKTLERLFLHAHVLGFAHPVSGEPVSVSTPLPAELRDDNPLGLPRRVDGRREGGRSSYVGGRGGSLPRHPVRLA